ncbi:MULTISPECIES: DUF5677 domain-containing protein [Burkholderia cepacia complex]|uniref:DUF5677 domain-containing protein n=1 Tax=Burkholderia cepacia complex TaxID=87882 RepID=UPI000F5AF78C|nr:MULTISPECIES: DUF5677 domain-containing protein [Burkholderia cepacia complex]MBR8308212.1 hypothetical protein [Burkholderia cenocepacia]MCO1344690.1 hypothetical protein [Burkholderia multivorans]MCO1442008.1 hypothetical protein [Burkholderia multivorans]MEC4774939.1 DUF5677 domain-containing protein [Burkholderia cenocepacia]UQO28130.1 hypothetical protein L0Z21_14395 [Burkholderia multivorans]
MDYGPESANSDETLEAWRAVATDAAGVLDTIGNRCFDLPPGTSLWSAKAVAARVALRSNELFGATLNLTSLGTLRAARMLVRGLLECTFAAAALTTKPDEFLMMLKNDSDKSRRNQGQFILDRRLGNVDLNRERLQRAVDAMDKRLQLISPKRVAELGPLVSLYLDYQRLSDDSAHVTGRSLEHYANRTKAGFMIALGEPTVDDYIATLHLALRSGLLTGVAISDVLGYSAERQDAMALLLRMEPLPKGKVI